MDAIIERWIACPRCGGDLAKTDGGVTCQSCGTRYAEQDGVLDLVDPSQKVSSEGPGDTLAMAWRRRRWDDLRGPEAPENAAYLAAIWERLRPDDRVVDLGSGPGSFPAWMAAFAPDLAILGLDLSWSALEEAGRTVGARPNVHLVRASTRRRLPLRDASTDVVLRRLAPGLPEEVVRVLTPGGHYLRFTFGPSHWREVYDLMPALPRAREDTLVGEAERLRQLGLEVEEPVHEAGTEEFSLPAVLLALRSNPAAFHAERLDLKPLRQLWRTEEGARAIRIPLTTDYAILVARRPAESVVVPVPGPAEATAEPASPARPAPRRSRARPAEAAAPSAEGALPAPPADAEATAPAARIDGEPVGDEPAAGEPAAGEPAVGEPAAGEPAPVQAATPAVDAAPAARRARRRPAPSAPDPAAEPAEGGAPAGAARTRSRRAAPTDGAAAGPASPRSRRAAASDERPATEEQGQPTGARRRARRGAEPAPGTAEGAIVEPGEAGPRRRSRRVATPAPTEEAAPGPAPGESEGPPAEAPRRRSRKAAAEPPAPPATRRGRKVAGEAAPAPPRRRARKAAAEAGGEPAEGAPGDAAAQERPKRGRARKPPAGEGDGS